ncbi:MAG: phospholipid carrier-dependent glycosyltransferase [Deltaproteobacteria bacterium]|nr:phospholipid carrier-dependent glycosyltransferase [Deltaproteobacteria bacterium]
MGSSTPLVSARPALLLALLGLGYFLFFFHQVDLAERPYWDERIYVNAARTYLSSQKPYPNPEHPPLGKQILSLGIELWGDRPQGWRFFSALSGALSGVLMVALTYRLTGRQGVAAFVGALFFLDPLLYLHFRLGMLDPPLLLFLLAATLSVFQFWENPKIATPYLYLTGLLLGLALATKMLALVLAPVFWVLAAHRLRREGLSKKSLLHLALAGFLLPAAVYFGTHAALGYGLGETWRLFLYNLNFHQYHRGAANMSSRWYEWLYVGKPLWYFWKQVEAGRVQAVLGTGNLVLWVGAELLACYAVYRKRRSPEVWTLAALILIQFALYAFKPITFLQYMVLILPFLYILMGVGIADLFDRFEGRYRRILQVDLACFFLGSLLVFWNYFPYLQGKVMSREAFEAVGAMGKALPPEQP